VIFFRSSVKSVWEKARGNHSPAFGAAAYGHSRRHGTCQKYSHIPARCGDPKTTQLDICLGNTEPLFQPSREALRSNPQLPEQEAELVGRVADLLRDRASG
jgi:hypothetical protein